MHIIVMLVITSIVYGQITESNRKSCTYSFVIPQTDLVTSCQAYNEDKVNQLQQQVHQLQNHVKQLLKKQTSSGDDLPSKSSIQLLSNYSCQCSTGKTTFEIQSKDCQDVKDHTFPGVNSGVFKIYPIKSMGAMISMNTSLTEGKKAVSKYISATSYAPITVFCELADPIIAWTVIMRRSNMDISFDRTFDEYKNGFGDMSNGDFWLGLQNMHILTHQTGANTTLVIEMRDNNNTPLMVTYGDIIIGNEDNDYAIVTTNHQGSENNLYHTKPFWARKANQASTTPSTSTTTDSLPTGYPYAYRRDVYTPQDCLNSKSKTGHGGWWFQGIPSRFYTIKQEDPLCGNSNLNALKPYWRGITDIRYVEMKIRRQFST